MRPDIHWPHLAFFSGLFSGHCLFDAPENKPITPLQKIELGPKDLEELDRYPWSGHAVILGNAVLEGQNIVEPLSFFATGKRESVKRYRLFVADGVSLGKRQEFGSGRRLWAAKLARTSIWDHQVYVWLQKVVESRKCA